MTLASPIIIRNLAELRGQVWEWRGLGHRIGFVPTMGALHEGHLSLITLAQNHAEKTIASLFVNPTQFAPGEDFEAYPRDEARDIDKLASVGCDLIYIPDPQHMYHPHHSTHLHLGGVAEGLETDFRPTFFDGVALVVTKLFNRVAPDVAIFGEKDYQQLATIRRLVSDLDLPIKIIGAPIIRDAHGLALSSRNRYFDQKGLTKARQLNAVLFHCAAQIRDGQLIPTALQAAHEALMSAGYEAVDYIRLAHPDTLGIMENGPISHPMRLLIAAHCDGVRLIDNCRV